MEIQSSRREFLKMTGYTTLGLACASCPDVHRDGQELSKRPNILFCISDDQSYPHAGIYGCTFVKTPAFDRIAKEGILFHNAFVSAPSCCPSRSSVLTGQDFYRLREASMNHTMWPGNLRTYPDMLAQAGYHVGYTGKGWAPGDWKVAGIKHNPAGPEYNEHKMKTPTKYISPIDYAKNFQAFLKKRSEGAPFCFWYGGVEPHRPYESGSALAHGKKLEQVQVPAFMPDSEQVRSDILDYGLAIDWFDQHLGKIIQILEDIDELDNTLIVATSDNGMPFPRAKATLYDYGTRMPLAVRWANKVKPGRVPLRLGASPGRVVEDFVSFVDFAPTFLEAAGLPIPSEMTGRSLISVLTSTESGQVDPSRDHAVFGIERHFPGGRAETSGYPMRAIRTKEYLYIKNYYPDRNPVGDHPGLVWPADDPVGGYGDIDGGPTKTYMWEHRKEFARLFRLTFSKRAAEELYDVRKDPYNLNNLADDTSYADVKNKLAAKLAKRLLQTKDPRATGKGHILDDIMRRFPQTKTSR